MSEQTSNPTSGQNVPKSKFRRKSRQEQTAASKLRMERRGEKLDAAREKLAKQKPPKKPGAVKRLAHTAGHGVHGFVHGFYHSRCERLRHIANTKTYHFGVGICFFECLHLLGNGHKEITLLQFQKIIIYFCHCLYLTKYI